jgi:hypothetical protein
MVLLMLQLPLTQRKTSKKWRVLIKKSSTTMATQMMKLTVTIFMKQMELRFSTKLKVHT